MILKDFGKHLNDKKIYKPDQIENVLKQVRPNFRFSQLNTKHKYFNVPATLDLETSSFYDKDGNKVGLMYVWIFGIYGKIIIGRTWDTLTVMLGKLGELLDLNENKRLIVFVHNAQFDFQFFRSHFTFSKVFASDRRQPLYALTDSGYEFRCSYMLSGLSLAKVGENLLKYKVKKRVGDLDYSLIRHAETPIDATELGYCADDGRVVMAFIAEEIERYNGIAALPLTKTGYVRNYCRNFIFRDPETGKKDKHRFYQNKDLMQNRLQILDAEMYDDLKRCFTGGFTHANSYYVGDVIENVASYDFTSSYPACMLDRFPMGHPERISCKGLDKETIKHYMDNYCTMFTIHVQGIKQRPEVFENYISRSKCIKCENPTINNGRVVRADYLELVITGIDYEIINAFYEWDEIRISDLYIWEWGYLPKDFILAILELYKRKTELKGVAGKEAEYMVSKGMLNSCYGMCVTDLIREVNEYTDHWEEPYLPDKDEAVRKYNRQRSRFLYYPWGIIITARARYNLFTAIKEAGDDYIYSDTDSIKLKNADKHKKYFEDYNRRVIKRLELCLDYYGIEHEYIRPKTIKGVEKPLGVWDYEGTYSRFKTLGAKRYLVEKDGNLELTVSGVNKKIAVPYLLNKYGSNTDIFDAFKAGLEFPAGKSGKLTHTYIDVPRTGYVTDYLGHTIPYEELTSIHMEPAGYNLTIGGDFVQYLIHLMKGV